jgi:hypothetical protein
MGVTALRMNPHDDGADSFAKRYNSPRYCNGVIARSVGTKQPEAGIASSPSPKTPFRVILSEPKNPLFPESPALGRNSARRSAAKLPGMRRVGIIVPAYRGIVRMPSIGRYIGAFVLLAYTAVAGAGTAGQFLCIGPDGHLCIVPAPCAPACDEDADGSGCLPASASAPSASSPSNDCVDTPFGCHAAPAHRLQPPAPVAATAFLAHDAGLSGVNGRPAASAPVLTSDDPSSHTFLTSLRATVLLI